MHKLFSRSLILVSILWIASLYNTVWAIDKKSPKIFKPVAPIKYKVQDLSAQLFSDNSILYVSGKIKNSSFQPIQGYVLIRFQDLNNTELGYVETVLNQNNPIQHNALGDFDISVNIGKNSRISNVSVEFVEFGK